MVRSFASSRLAALLLLGVLAGCTSSALDPAKPSLPLPTYSVGDRFSFDDGKTDRVTTVDGDWIGWQRGKGYRWTGHRDFIAPIRDWETSKRNGHLELVTTPHGAIWPLQPGRSVWFAYATRVTWKDGSNETTYAYRWHCDVKDRETVTVPAGTFETVPVSCDRHADRSGRFYGERTWYYAPRVGHYVLYINRPVTGTTRRKALKSYRLRLPKLARAQSAFYNTELQTALQTIRSGIAHTAEGAGLKVAITPVRTYKIATGRYCREYRRTIELAGREYGARGTSCLMENGNWRPQRRSRKRQAEAGGSR